MTIVPTKDDAAIAHRLRIVREDLGTMRQKIAFIGIVGGHHPLFQRVEFHAARVRLLEWAAGASTQEIDDRRRALQTSLGAAVSFRYGSVLGLPSATVAQIAHLEILEYCLGVHAYQLERAQ